MMVAYFILAFLIVYQGGLGAKAGCSLAPNINHKDAVKEQKVKSINECGHSKLNITNEPLRGTDRHTASLGEFPWQAAIYFGEGGNWQQDCGGTLITDRAVLTAVSCLVSSALYYQSFLTVRDPRNIRVALGKLDRLWNVTSSSEIRRDVKEVIVHPDYLGPQASGEQYNLAILVLDAKVPISDAIMPACLDYSLNKLPPHQQAQIGYVAGFGYMKHCFLPGCGGSTEFLLSFSRGYVLDFTACNKTAPRLDKFSVKRLSEQHLCFVNTTVSPVLNYNTGGGLTVNHLGLHYVIGVENFRVLKIKGNTLEYLGGFINVSKHMDWINFHLTHIANTQL